MMIEMLEKTVGMLKARVNMNLEIIKQNQKKIKSILVEPVSNDRTQRLEKESAVNKKLLSENHDFINMQLSLINFMENHRDTLNKMKSAPKDKSEKIDFFRLTVSGEIPFDENHPKFDDIEFFNDLMQYFQVNENYEKCAELKQTKDGEEIDS